MTYHSKKTEEEIDPFDIVHTSDPNDADPMWYSMAEDSGEIILLDDEVKTIEVKKEKKLIVSASLIKDLMYNGTEIDYCPNYIYHKYLTDTEVMKPSDAMIKGSFGETILLGGSARGKSTPDLERKRNGEKTIDQERIEAQCMNAENIMKLRNMNLIKGVNTQVLFFKNVILDRGNGEKETVLCRGEFDWFPTTFINDDGELEIANIDIKFTGDLRTVKNFGTGEALWGNFEEMDDTQALMYLYLIEDIDWNINNHISPDLKKLISSLSEHKIHFYFWVFDYKRPITEIENKFFKVEFNPFKRREIIERIRKTVSIFDFHNKMNDWEKKIPCKSCGNCILECEIKNRIKSK